MAATVCLYFKSTIMKKLKQFSILLITILTLSSCFAIENMNKNYKYVSKYKHDKQIKKQNPLVKQ